MRRLQAVTDAAIAHLSLDELLDELLERIRDALEADTCAVLLVDEAAAELVARAAKGLEGEVEQGVRIPVGAGFAGRVAAERKPLTVDDVERSDVVNPILREKGVRSLLGAPLIAHGRVIGIVHVGTLTPRRFSAQDVELIEVVAARAALAVDRALVYEEVVRLTEMHRDFISLAAHELRTPVANIYGLASTLQARRRRLEPHVVDELLESLFEQAARTRRLVEQLLDLSRVEAAFEIRPEQVPLRRHIEGIVRTVASERPRDVRVDVADDLVVFVDAAVIEHVVGNLVVNALHYGSPPVTIGAEQSDRHLRVSVADRGEGIADEFVPLLFERFHRNVDPAEPSPGSGLGLAIARSYARAHGGDVVYAGSTPQGARFELVVPAERLRA